MEQEPWDWYVDLTLTDDGQTARTPPAPRSPRALPVAKSARSPAPDYDDDGLPLRPPRSDDTPRSSRKRSAPDSQRPPNGRAPSASRSCKFGKAKPPLAAQAQPRWLNDAVFNVWPSGHGRQESVRVGSTVVLRGSTSRDCMQEVNASRRDLPPPSTTHEEWFAEIVGFWTFDPSKPPEALSSDEVFIKCQWYWRPHGTLMSIEASNFFTPDEVFFSIGATEEEAMNDRIRIEDIVDICEIRHLKPRDPYPPHGDCDPPASPSQRRPRILYCRYGYNIKSYDFVVPSDGCSEDLLPASQLPEVLDVFSGCGGISTGLSRAGFNIIAGIEKDPVAAKSFERLHPHAKMYNKCIDDFLWFLKLVDRKADYDAESETFASTDNGRPGATLGAASAAASDELPPTKRRKAKRKASKRSSPECEDDCRSYYDSDDDDGFEDSGNNSKPKVYDLEDIVAKTTPWGDPNERGVFYLCKWRGFDVWTWERRANVENLPTFKEFDKKHKCRAYCVTEVLDVTVDSEDGRRFPLLHVRVSPSFRMGGKTVGSVWLPFGDVQLMDPTLDPDACTDNDGAWAMYQRRLELIRTAPGWLTAVPHLLLVGGPPCQGLSRLNRQRHLFEDNPFKHPQTRLILSYLELAAYLRPDYLLLENVCGMLDFADSKVIREIVARLVSLDYQVSFALVNAAQISPVPQLRVRVFISAAKRGLPMPAFPPVAYDIGPHALQGLTCPRFFQPNYVGFISRPPGLPPSTKISDAISDLPPKAVMHTDGRSWEPVPYAFRPAGPYQIRARCPDPRFAAESASEPSAVADHVVPASLRWQPPDNRPRYGDHSSTITCNFVGGRDKRNSHPSENRFFSVRELLRMQGFYDYVRLAGTVRQQLRQIGNSVPPPVAEAFGRQLMRLFQRPSENPDVEQEDPEPWVQGGPDMDDH